MEAVGVVEGELGIEGAFDLGIDAAVCYSECVEVDWLRVRAVECPGLDLLVLRMEIVH